MIPRDYSNRVVLLSIVGWAILIIVGGTMLILHQTNGDSDGPFKIVLWCLFWIFLIGISICIVSWAELKIKESYELPLIQSARENDPLILAAPFRMDDDRKGAKGLIQQ